MNTSSPTTEAINAIVDSLESHEGDMSERERQLCTTLLHGLACVDRLRLTAPVRAADGSLAPYDFATATESERWAFDQGVEAGYKDALSPKSLVEVREVIAALEVALDRIIAERACLGDGVCTNPRCPQHGGWADR